MRRRLLVLLLAALAWTSGCSVDLTFGRLDTEALEADIERGLDEQLAGQGIDIIGVTCPDDVAPRTGDVFTCRAAVDDGSTAIVTVTQTDDQGNVTWEISDVTG